MAKGRIGLDYYIDASGVPKQTIRIPAPERDGYLHFEVEVPSGPDGPYALMQMQDDLRAILDADMPVRNDHDDEDLPDRQMDDTQDIDININGFAGYFDYLRREDERRAANIKNRTPLDKLFAEKMQPAIEKLTLKLSNRLGMDGKIIQPAVTMGEMLLPDLATVSQMTRIAENNVASRQTVTTLSLHRNRPVNNHGVAITQIEITNTPQSVQHKLVAAQKVTSDGKLLPLVPEEIAVHRMTAMLDAGDDMVMLDKTPGIDAPELQLAADAYASIRSFRNPAG